MKRKLTRILIVVIIALTSTNKVKAQSLEQGDITIDVFYGAPYFLESLLKTAYQESNPDGKYTNTNHIGGKVDYAVNDNISIGGEFTYADTKVKYDEAGENFTAGIKKLRALGKITFHFATGDKLDPYFTTGVGYTGAKIYSNEEEGEKIKANIPPVAIRAGIGVRYFFTPNIGINAEVGIGGPLAQGGLSFRF